MATVDTFKAGDLVVVRVTGEILKVSMAWESEVNPPVSVACVPRDSPIKTEFERTFCIHELMGYADLTVDTHVPFAALPPPHAPHSPPYFAPPPPYVAPNAQPQPPVLQQGVDFPLRGEGAGAEWIFDRIIGTSLVTVPRKRFTFTVLWANGQTTTEPSSSFTTPAAKRAMREAIAKHHDYFAFFGDSDEEEEQ